MVPHPRNGSAPMFRHSVRQSGLVAWLLVIAAVAPNSLNAQSAQTLFEQGQALELKGKSAEAIAAYTRAIAVDPKFSEAYRRRALVLSSTGDRPAAIADFTRAIDADPKNARAYNGRASARMNLKDYATAMKDLDSALALDPNYSNAWSNRGRIKADGLGDLLGALADMNRSIEADPKNRVTYWVRGDVKVRLKDLDGAIADYTTAHALDPRDASPLILRANAKVERKDATGALADYDSALKILPSSAPALLGRGKVLAATGDATGATRDFNSALAINPGLTEAKDQLAKLGEGQKVALFDAAAEAARPRTQPAVPAPAPAAAPPPPLPAAPAPARTAPAPVDGRVMVNEIPPELAEAIAKYKSPTRSREPDVPWQAPRGTPVKLATHALPSTMPPALNINQLTIEQFNGAVSTAMEQMRLLQGPMSPEDTRRFEKKWAPLFDAPTAEVIDYFNKLNPLLAEFISVRTQIEMGAEEYRAHVVAAGMAADLDDEAATRQALDVAAQQKSAIEAQQARLAVLLGKIQELGNPPDPVASKRRARARHEQAMKIFAQEPPYRPLLGAWVGEAIPVRGDCERGAMVMGFLQGTYQPSEHIQVKLAPGVRWPWDRPDQLVHDPTSGAITYAVGFGGFFASLPLYSTCIPSVDRDGRRLGVRWTTEGFSIGTWGAAWNYPPFIGMDTIPKMTLVRVNGDELHGNLVDSKGADAYRIVLHRVLDRVAPDPPEFDSGTLERQRKLLAEADETLRELYRASPRDMAVIRKATAQRDTLVYRSGAIEAYRSRASLYLAALTGWTPQTAAAADDPSRAVELRYQGLRTQADQERAAAAAPSAAPPAAPVPEPTAAPAPPTELTMTEKERSQEIADAKLRILSLEKDVEWYRKQLNTLKPEQLEYAELNLRSKQADILQERDYINYLQSGVYEHTRSPLDEWNFARGVASAEQDALNAHITKQGAAALYKMVELADPAQKDELRAFISRQLTPQVLGGNDAAKIKQVMEAVSSQALGYQQKQGAKAEEDAVDEEEKEYWTRQAVTALGVATGGAGAMAMAEAGITGAALQAGSMGIGAMYGAATGYVEGGPVQAVEQAAASTGLVAFGIIEGMKGYHEPVIDPATGQPTGEVRGWAGAAERAGTAVAVGWLIGKGVQVVAGFATPAIEGGLKKLRPTTAGAGPRVPSNAELAAANKSGRDVVSRYSELRNRLTAATKNNAPKEEIAIINRQLEAVANEVDANYASKSLLQKMQKTGTEAEKYLAKDFRVRQRMLNQRVDRQFDLDRTSGKGGTEGIHYEEWTSEGWVKRPLRFRDIRNASSGQKLNMDRDKALIEHPLFGPGLDGKVRPIARNWVYNADGTPKSPRFRLVDGSGKSITMAKANEQLQATFNKSYGSVTGQNPEAAFQTLTSSANAEAYTDLQWIRDLSDVRNIRILEATGAASARQVATFKGFHSGDPALAPILKERETARASSKEIKLRLLNIIKGMKNVSPAAKEQSLQHWQELSEALDGYVENPVTGYQKLRSLTGKSLAETMADIGYAIEAGVRFGKF